MIPVLEAVPNVSSGRDPQLLNTMVQAVGGPGVEVVHVTSDPDHDRSVLTLLGAPDAVVDACLSLARIAVAEIDVGRGSGVHPRVGALDVVPLVPLQGVSMEEAVRRARELARRLVDELALPVYLYAEASDPPGRGLAEIRGHGGFEGLRDADPSDGSVPHPDLPADGLRVHPTAGATCVGARPLLLAWNVDVEGLSMAQARALARRLRERDGGFEGLRTLALDLPEQGRRQISMNLEDVGRRAPMAVFAEIEEGVMAAGGRVVATEIIGLRPDEFLHLAGAERIALLDPDPSLMVSSRLAAHLSRRCRDVAGSLRALAVQGGDPDGSLARRLIGLADELHPSSPPDERQ